MATHEQMKMQTKTRWRRGKELRAFPEVRGYPTVPRRTAANGVGVNPRDLHTPNRACGDEAREIRNCIRHARLRTLSADVLVSDSVEGFLGRAGQKARE
jgi:hypothetical protein